MKYKVTIKDVKEDYYQLTIQTYKDKLEGIFERSELRELIRVIDNHI